MLAITAAAFIPFGFWAKALRGELSEQITRTTGLSAQAQGPVRIALLPWPRVSFSDVAIGREGGAIHVRAERMRADLSVSRLFSGRVEFSRLSLVRPSIMIDAAGTGADAGPAIRRASEAPSASGEARRADRVRLGVIYVSDGEVRLRAPEQRDVLLQSVDATLDWGSLGSPAALKGSTKWRGERFDIEALLSRPAEVIRGERSPFTIKATSRLVDLSLNGAVTGGARWLVEARLASTSERFNQFLDLLELRPALPGRLSRVAVTGQIRALPQSATISDLRLTLDGSVFDGALSIRAGAARPMVSGTLATRAYEVRVGRSGAPVLRSRDRTWSREALSIGALDLFDADLRVSAARLTLGRAVVTDAGFLIAINDGRLDITTASAEGYGGSIRGRFIFDSRPAIPEIRLTGTVRNINLAQFTRAHGGFARLGGIADLEASIEGVGSSVHALMQQLSGAVRLEARNLEVGGVDLEKALRRTEKRPLSIPVEVRTGQTTFLTAKAEGLIHAGVLKLEHASANGLGADVSLTGAVAVADRSLRLDILATQPRSSSAAAAVGREPASLVLDLVGSWDDPQLSIDPESLINRSEAAAPLLRRQTPAATPAATPASSAAPASLER